MKLTKPERAALLAVRDGADIYDYGIACALRSVQKKASAFLDITEALMAPEDGAKRQPYFGAIATSAGVRAAQQAG